MPRNCVVKIAISNFDSDHLTFDFPAKNCQNRAKSNSIFPGKIGIDFAIIWIALWLKFSILAIFSEKQEVNTGPKGKNLGISSFFKDLNISRIPKTNFFSPLIITLVKISSRLDNIWES